MVKRTKKFLIGRITEGYGESGGGFYDAEDLKELSIDELEGILEEVSDGAEGQMQYSSKLRSPKDKKFNGHTTFRKKVV